MTYADVDYLGIVYRDAEYINGLWYFQREPGEMHAFIYQERVKQLNPPQPKPRHRRKPAGLRASQTGG